MIEVDHTARVSGLAFMGKEDASWVAITCLIFSEGAEANFNDLYTGTMAGHFLHWVHENMDSMSPEKRSECLGHLIQFERPRMYARDMSLKCDAISVEDINPLGYVLSMIWKGASKEAAIGEASSANNYLRTTSDPENLEQWPSSFKGLSRRSFEKRWTRYQRILPHVLAYYLRTRAMHEGREAPTATEVPHIALELQRRLYRQAKTKPPSLAPWKVLSFS